MLKHLPGLHSLKPLDRQKLKTWDFAAKFITRQRKIDIFSKNSVEYKTSMIEFGKWTNAQLVELGPTFVKLGQLLSTRQDVFPTEFTTQLESLQDDVSPLDSSIVFDIISTEVGLDKFLAVSSQPFKAASLGQVHKAKLSNGKSVIVKVKRPGIKELIESDTQNISDILNFLNLVGISTGPSTKKILEDAKEYILDEVDYIKEGHNAVKFQKLFKDTSWVKVPNVYMKYLTPKVIIMEYVEGIKVTDIESLKKRKALLPKICRGLVMSYVIQVRDYGYFHADPHPGNVAITEDGKIVYYDFGLVVQIPLQISAKINDLLVCIIQRDTRRLVQLMIDLELIIPTTDQDDIVAFLDALLLFFESYDSDALNQTVIQNELNTSLVRERPFLLPPEFLFLGKSLILIDGICRKLEPDFNFIAYVTPIINEEVMEAIDLRKIASSAVEMPNRVKAINSSVSALEKSKSELKRNLRNTRSELQTVQLSTVTAICASQLLQNGNWNIFFIFALATIYNIIKLQNKKL
jgi:predicted unusual protein kinase regulating ubiquinone biosynthesis (AarF/ABC1/UbiB family)